MLDCLLSKSGNGRARGGAFLDLARLRHAAWAFTTRRVRGVVCGIADTATPPEAGNLVLARVDSIGYHSGIQLPDGRRKNLFVGDEIVVAYGNRYAPNQFLAAVPEPGPCQLVAAGGVAGKVLAWHGSITKNPTQITPVGQLKGPTGLPVNLRDYALPSIDQLPARRPATIAVAGTSMDSGKTQTAAYLARGLTLAGLRVGFAKVTGTGAGGDTWLLKDAGANPVLDFTDAGLASTYLVSPAQMERVFVTLMAHLIKSRVDAIVLELADGVLQVETAAVLTSSPFREAVGGILFTAGDAMGAVSGEAWLKSRDLPLLAFSGILSSSPLQRDECCNATGLPVFSRQDLANGATAVAIVNAANQRRPVAAGVGSLALVSREEPGRDEFVPPSKTSHEPPTVVRVST